MMPDPAHYADLLRQSMDELEGAFLDMPKPVKKPKKTATKTMAKKSVKKAAKVKK